VASIDAARALFEEAIGDRAALLDALFRREARVAHADVRRLLGPGATDHLFALGMLDEVDGAIEGRVRLVGFRGQLIVSDRYGYRRHADFVIGPGPASAIVADAVRPIERGHVLDLGCGPGTQTLWRASGANEVLGLDISDRALAFAAFNLRLNARAGVAFARGDFLTAPPDPALDERFDVVLANPPFVLAPATELRYRDRPLPGDSTTRTALERVARALAPGGRGYVLGSWLDAGRGSWDERPRGWLRGLGVRGAIARVSSQTAVEYATLWNRDLEEPARAAAIGAWSTALEAEGAGQITTGVIGLPRPARHALRRAAPIVPLDGGRPAWPAPEPPPAG